jgi:hypothetical protein
MIEVMAKTRILSDTFLLLPKMVDLQKKVTGWVVARSRVAAQKANYSNSRCARLYFRPPAIKIGKRLLLRHFFLSLVL